MTKDLLAQMAEAARATPDDRSTDRLRRACVDLAETEMMIQAADDRLSELKKRRVELSQKILPDIMNELGVDSFGLPEFESDLTLGPYAHASIPTDLPDAERDRAFLYLERRGGGDLIKTTLTYEFGRGDLELAMRVAEIVTQHSNEAPVPTLQKTVHWGTLTSFVKEQVANPDPDDPIDPARLHATVGQVVKLKKRKN